MRIYLDHNATTPLRDEVVDAMSRTLADCYGNPSSTHAEGADARARVEDAREQVATCLGTAARTIYFTGGATESNNTLLRGLAEAPGERRGVVTTEIEHPSVVEPCAWLESRGIGVTRVPVDDEGLVDPDVLDAAIGEQTALVSVILANNETGVVQHIDEIAHRVKARGAHLHVDATQAIGKWPVDMRELPADYLSCSAHKLNGPKGVGCLVVAADAPLIPLLLGGGQERRQRGGTENVAGIVGFGVACELARVELDERMAHYASLRDRLWKGLRDAIPGTRRNGHAQRVLPNTLNVELEGTAGEVVLQALDLEGVAISAGAACHSGSISPSHVLTAMGRTPEQARGSLRLSVGHGNDEAQIDRVVQLLPGLAERAREAGAV
jgi:cysteine desulfurase